MPFIKSERRYVIDERGLWALDEVQVGDCCYEFYKPMVDRWKSNPRWTTAHEIYKDMICSINESWDLQAAKELAWQVFFQLYVMPYELKKREENGDV